MDYPKPLEGISVLDFTWVFAGPHATKHLAAFGAEVVKVESAVKPDPMRHGFGYGQFDSDENLDVSALYNAFNLGKKDIRLNLTTEKGQEIAKELAAKADVVMENFAPGFTEKIGLDYKSLQKVNDSLVYVSMPGWGQTGPAKKYRAWGMNLESMAGLDDASGFKGDPPTSAGFSWPDPTVGILGAIATLMALHSRETTGEGHHVELSQFEATVTFLFSDILDYQLNNEMPEKIGNKDADGRYIQGVYNCDGHDKWAAIAIETEEQWIELCSILGRKDLLRDPRLESQAKRIDNQDIIDEAISNWTKHRAPETVRGKLQQEGIPAGLVADEEDLLENDPQLRIRDFFRQFDHPDIGLQSYPGLPFEMDKSEIQYKKRSPKFGEHTNEILQEWIGMSDDRIEDLIENEVLY